MATTRNMWVHTVLSQALGVTPASSVTALIVWTVAESTNEACDGKSGAAWNPINTTLGQPGVTPYNTFGNGLHVWNYPTQAEGVAATIATLRQENMAPILTAMRDARSVGYILARIAASPWGTGSAVWGALTRYAADPGSYQRLYVGEPGSAPPTPAEAPLPVGAWKWAEWRLNIGAYKNRGYPDQSTRPLVPRRIPLAWWRAVAWYQRHT